MIEHLYISNVALIEKLNISFSLGLNILSGETGAGKSIIIDSINFVLGSRTDRDFIRGGQEVAEVSLMVRAEQKSVAEAITALGVQMEEDGALLISRSYNSQGKSLCRINGKPATVGMVRELAALIVDMHGQHEHQSLLNSSRHIMLLDKFCDEALEPLKAALAESIRGYKNVIGKIKALTIGEKNISQRKEILEFQYEEIHSAQLKSDEEENLTVRRDRLINSERLRGNSLLALELLSGDESDEPSAYDKISKALSSLRELAEFDESRAYMASELEDVSESLSELIRDLRIYSDGFESDEDNLDQMESRLNQIYELKRKYGGSVETALEHLDKISQELEQIENMDQELKTFNQEKKALTVEILRLCGEISATRQRAANTIKSRLLEVLSDLGMKNAKFDILIERKKEFSVTGYDRVEFLISANPGEQLKPLAKIASGGEMSRIMLALKTVLADADNIETFIFDEIDTGVSGRTAQQVAEKLAFISRRHQILCITHLPQIAAMADKHFLIEKKIIEGKTITEVFELDHKSSVQELARLTGGAKITAATLKASEEMKKMAADMKEAIL